MNLSSIKILKLLGDFRRFLKASVFSKICQNICRKIDKYIESQGIGILEILDINQGECYRFFFPIYFSYGEVITVFFNILLFLQGFYFSETNFFQLDSL
jgi:hypothetical protein